MFLIVGLGNPGAEYAGQRHNIGFMAVDEIHRRHGFSSWRKKFSGELSDGMLGGEKVILLKPVTYMNVSGQSVGEAARFYKIEPKNIIVIHDELDLPPGKPRLKTGGGSGGHNGLKSLDQHIGANYQRLRLGIGHPGDRDLVSRYVLHDFSKADQQWLTPLLEKIADEAPLLTGRDTSKFINRLHLAKPGGKTKKAEKPEAEAKKKSAETAAKPEKSGAMADALSKLFGLSGAKK